MSVRKKSTGLSAAQPLSQPESPASDARYLSDLQDDGSIAQQQHDCREGADEAVSGPKLRRDGLDAAIAAGERGEYQALFIQSLSRPARESLIGMSALKDLDHNDHIRVISTSEELDTIHEGWDTQATCRRRRASRAGGTSC